MFLASLPWYDLKETRPATNALWRGLAKNLRSRGFRDVPEMLDRQIPYVAQWTSGKLLFSQACGYDILLSYPNDLQIVATPVYTASGCKGSNYSSIVVVRDDSPVEHIESLRGSRCVINTLNSHSGMNALRALVAPLHLNGKFFSAVALSGSHESSLRLPRGRRT